MYNRFDNIDLSPYIDQRNEELFQSLCDDIFDIYLTEQKDYTCYFDGMRQIIAVSSSTVNPAFFAHELLHVKIHTVDNAFYIYDWQQTKLSKRTYNHLVNTLEHIIMLPAFLDLGYPEDSFLSNGNQRLISIKEIESHNHCLDSIIADCCTVLGNCLSFFNYQEEREYLKSNFEDCYIHVNNIIIAWDKYMSFNGVWTRFYYNGLLSFLQGIKQLFDAKLTENK